MGARCRSPCRQPGVLPAVNLQTRYDLSLAQEVRGPELDTIKPLARLAA